MTEQPILSYPDSSKQFQLTTDSSNFALGASITRWTSNSYASRTLNPPKQNYGTIEKELLAIVWGEKFTAFSDHEPLE